MIHTTIFFESMIQRSVWPVLRLILFVVLLVPCLPANAAPLPQSGYAPTYTVWATREGLVGKRTANGHVIQPRDRFVALPSWRVLSSLGGHEFQVRVTYGNRSVVLPVWDVGPWNTHDDYWSPDRERYRDLPVGVPMAQAAVLDGYNGGLDEFGRVIQDPNGIDIADGAFWDDLQMTRTAKVQVTFLWMGRDPGPPPGAIDVTPGTPQPANPPAQPASPPAAPPAQPQATPTPSGPAAPAPSIPAGGLAVDNSDANYNADQQNWFKGNCGVNDSHAWTYSTNDPAKATHSARWKPSLPSAGIYEVMAYIPPCGDVQASTSTTYKVTHANGTSEVKIDQQAALGTWASLGSFSFNGNAGQQVELSDLTADERRSVRFDALVWVQREDHEPPNATISKITRQNNGYLIEWESDDVSGIEFYDVQVRQLPNGIWRDWRMGTSETSAWFGPDEGRHFAFRVRARDRAGNLQEWPPEEQMTTREAIIP